MSAAPFHTTSAHTSILCENAALRSSWFAVARSVEVGSTPVSVQLLASKVVLWRGAEGTVNAAPDRCPHREAPLSEGKVEDGCLVCPYHGWNFADGGTCVLVPSSGEGAAIPPKAHLHVHHAAERYGLVWVSLDEPRSPIPDIAQEDDPAFRRINTAMDVWQTSATRMADNFCDITHFPWVHTGTFGRRQDQLAPKVELGELDPHWYGYSYSVQANNASDLGSVVSGQTAEVVGREMSTGFNLPFNVRSTVRYENGLEHIILMLSAPIDDVTTIFTFVIWRNDDFAQSAEEVIRFDMRIAAEDKLILEKLDGVLPLQQTALVSVQADRCSVEWRRQLVDYMGL